MRTRTRVWACAEPQKHEGGSTTSAVVDNGECEAFCTECLRRFFAIHRQEREEKCFMLEDKREGKERTE